jgi:LysM repeat protein
MKSLKSIVIAVTTAALVALVFTVTPIQAAPVEQTNLLTNPSFEGGTYSHAAGQVPNGWSPWYDEARVDNCRYFRPNYELEPHPPHVHSGTYAARMWTAYQGHRGGLYQTVNATAGTNYRFTIYGFAWSTDNPQVDTPSTSTSAMAVGIDPTGGTNPWASTVIWSADATVMDRYQLFSVEAVAQGNKITVFTRNNPTWCVARNDAFWDDASLIATGQTGQPTPMPGQTAQPPSQPTQPPSSGVAAGSIIPSTPNPDGSIIHVVSSGETLIGIAVTYNVTLDEIRQLNNLTSDVILVGQRLLIRPPQATATPVPPTPTPTPEGGVQPTPTMMPQGNGTICVLSYEDANTNGFREAGELGIAGITFTVSNETQVVSTFTTDGSIEPHCFVDLTPGTYIVTWIGDAYVPTTDQSWAIGLEAGATVSHEFGVQPAEASAQRAGESAGTGGGMPTWLIALLGSLGAILLLGGLGVVAYFLILQRRQI